MMNIYIELDEAQVRRLVTDYISKQLGYEVEEKKVNIQVKSSQNWKSEWETAKFRAIYQEQK